MRRLILDHLTLMDAPPVELVEIATRTGYDGVGMFVQSMAVLPHMPTFDLLSDKAMRRDTAHALRATGVTLDLAYPLTIAGSTAAPSFEPLLAAVAELGGRNVNVLGYDRETDRFCGKLAEIADMAGGYDLSLALEFYPASRVRSLDAAEGIVNVVGRDNVGVTVDVLHLVRSGGIASAQRRLSSPRIIIAQLCDGLASVPPENAETEAADGRLLPGHGVFELPEFVKALRPDCPISTEVPNKEFLNTSPIARAKRAIDATRELLAAISDEEVTFAHGRAE